MRDDIYSPRCHDDRVRCIELYFSLVEKTKDLFNPSPSIFFTQGHVTFSSSTLQKYSMVSLIFVAPVIWPGKSTKKFWHRLFHFTKLYGHGKKKRILAIFLSSVDGSWLHRSKYYSCNDFLWSKKMAQELDLKIQQRGRLCWQYNSNLNTNFIILWHSFRCSCISGRKVIVTLWYGQSVTTLRWWYRKTPASGASWSCLKIFSLPLFIHIFWVRPGQIVFNNSKQPEKNKGWRSS